MGKGTAIEWAHHTFNAWWGCHEASPACDHCYAREFSQRLGFQLWGASAPRRFFGDAHWEEPRRWHRAAVAAGVRPRVFTMSMGDWCEPRPDLDAPRARLLALIETTPALEWLLLTKWPELITRYVPRHWLAHPLAHVQFGTTTETQEFWDRRVRALLNVPAAGHFVSAEPLLGPIDPREEELRRLRQVIVGGENGNGRRDAARLMHPTWVTALRDRAVDAGVAFFFKQWGDWVPISGQPIDGDRVVLANPWHPLNRRDADGRPEHSRPWNHDVDGNRAAVVDGFGSARMRWVGKKRAGRVLEGRTWDDVPRSSTDGI